MASDVVVVTGASAGVGRATAAEFGKRGAKVALIARGFDGLEGARRDVEAAGGSAMAIPTDVSDPDAVEVAAQTVEQELGPIDIWVNAAMATIFSPVAKLAPEEIRRATEVTYLGTVYGTMAALKRMRERNRGTIVQVGSALSYRAIPLQAAYCGAKFAIRGFTDSLRSELIHDNLNIGLTMVQLSAFNTPQFSWARTHMDHNPQPLPPIYQPQVAARGIVYAAYHPRRELWVGAPAVETIVGNRLLAPYLDKYLAKKGYTGQLTDIPIDPNRPDNLFEPLPGDHGIEGRFSNKAKQRSPELWATTHRNTATVMMAMAAGMLWSVWRRKRR